MAKITGLSALVVLLIIVVLGFVIFAVVRSTIDAPATSTPTLVPKTSTSTPSAIPTDTSTPTASPTASPTPLPTLAALRLSEHFIDSGNKGCLPVKSYREKEWIGSAVISNEEYVIEGKRQAESGAVVPIFKLQCLGSVSNFSLQVDARLSKPLNPDTSVGVALRSDDRTGNYYLFEYKNDGEYRIMLYENYSGSHILPTNDQWARTDAVKADDWNTLEVYGIGNTFYIYMNGQSVAQFSDFTYTIGLLGLAARFATQNDVATWEFDNIVVRTP